jgi:hypothetical protein
MQKVMADMMMACTTIRVTSFNRVWFRLPCPSMVSPTMRSFFTGTYWNDTIKWDCLLSETVNRSLDLTIDRLGRDQFSSNLVQFRKANQAARDKCMSQNVFPCSPSGECNKEVSCLWSDSGCGYKCLDDIANELGIA